MWSVMTWVIRRGTHLVTRDLVLFGFGMWGLYHETVNGPERQSFLLLFAAMVGAPFVLRADEYISGPHRRRRRREDEE